MCLVACALTLVLAQSAAPTVRGTVWDDGTGEPIAGAVVALLDVGQHTRTDSAGRYELRGTPGRTHHLYVTRLGYRAHALEILLPLTGSLDLDVSLVALPARLAEVDILERTNVFGRLGARRALVEPIGSRSITAEQVRTQPLLAEPDFMLALSSVGDVAVAPESPTTLHVRGGASDQNLVLIDGVPVYSPVHASGSFGALNPDALSSIELHAGVAPARLGGGLSSIVEMRSLAPRADRLRARGGASVTSARVMLEGPIAGTGAQFLISGRRGAPTLLAHKRDDARLRSSSGDLLAKLTAGLAGGRLALLSVSVADHASFAAGARGSESPSSGSDGVAVAASSADFDVARRHGFEWGSRSHGLSWRRELAGGAGFEVRLWQASYEAEIDWAASPVPLSLASARATDALESALTIDAPDHHLQVGVELQRHRADYSVRGPEGYAASASSYELSAQLATLAAYVDDAVRLGERWELMGGARGVILPGGSIVLEPRVALRLRPLSSVSLALGYGRTHQVAQSLRNPESLAAGVSGADLPILAGMAAAPAARADQLAAAAEVQPAAGMRVALDGYVRRLEGLVLVAPGGALPFAIAGFETGRGRAAGLALTMDWERDKLTASGSLGVARVVTSTDRVSFRPSHAPTSTLTAGFAYRPSPRTTWRTALFARSGRPSTLFEGPFEWEGCNPLDGGCEIVGTPELPAGALGAVRLPPYIRLDLGARRSWQARILGHGTVFEGHITLSNMLDRRNVWAVLTEPNGASEHTAPMRSLSVLNAGIDWRY
ncbi:MAG: TonB-dependent receptor [Gemmatimonadota bacterium]|nr:TonB-dependent receptor [Gemmatimonadota bacterium]